MIGTLIESANDLEAQGGEGAADLFRAMTALLLLCAAAGLDKPASIQVVADTFAEAEREKGNDVPALLIYATVVAAADFIENAAARDAEKAAQN